MPFFACLRKREGHRFRLDTRIYLRDEGPGGDDHCVAAIIGKNPGSAKGKEFNCLASISLDGDKLLPYVRKRFRNAYQRAGVEIPGGAYVRVWNLFYLCNKRLSAAVTAHAGVRQPLTCRTECDRPPIVWFAWGPPKPWFRRMPSRFLGQETEYPFSFDMDSKKIVAAMPGPTSRVKHTQGLAGESVEAHLASILRTRARAARSTSRAGSSTPTTTARAPSSATPTSAGPTRRTSN